MATTYEIWVREWGSDRDAVLCRVGSNPEAIAQAARGIWFNKVKHMRRYAQVWIEEVDVK